jgi:mitochondrial fission protein ELM1
MPQVLAPIENVTVAPTVWVLTGHKAGDNAQLLALAEALGWPFEVKRFVYKRHEIVPNMLLRTTLAGIDKQRSSALEGPWPDLVLTAGRRNEPIARWVKKQSRGMARIVHVGRPWSSLDRFDLIITTPQYRLPVQANVLHNKTPLHRVTKERTARDAARWQARLQHLPRPFVTVVVGGSSPPYSFDDATAERLAREASVFAAERGGSLLITTSARTPSATIDALERNIEAPAHLFRWTRDARDNPYFAFLGLADAIIVTGDSMSMLAEACATRKPVYIFDLGEGKGAMRKQTMQEAIATDSPRRRRKLGFTDLSGFLYSQVTKLGPSRLHRDIRNIHEYLVDSGRAVWLGEEFAKGRPVPAIDCLGRAVARVRALMETVPARGPVFGERATDVVPLRRFA